MTKPRAVLLIAAAVGAAFAGSALVRHLAALSVPAPASGFAAYYLRGLAQPIPVVQFAASWSVLIAVWLTIAVVSAAGFGLVTSGGARSRCGPVIAGFVCAGLALSAFSILQAFDAYYYVAYGRLYGVFGIDPYALTTAVHVNDATLSALYAVLHNPPFGDPYGPGFTLLAGLLARAESNTGLVFQLWSWRLVGVLSALAIILALRRMLKNVPDGERARRLAAFAFNPVVLYESAVGAHNDVLMIAPAVWAFALVDDFPLIAGILAGASIALKYVAIIALPFLVIRAWKKNVFGAILLGCLALVVPALCAQAFHLGRSAAASDAAIGSSLLMSLNWLLALPFLRSGAGSAPIASGFGPFPFIGDVTWPRLIQLALFAAVAIVLVASVVRYAKRQSVADIVRPIAALVLAMPALHPWYVVWLAPACAARGSWAVYAAWFGSLALLGYAHEGVIPSPLNEGLFVAAAFALVAAPIVAAQWRGARVADVTART
ncbi:MAG TPA: glycosyltransferase 87 family protein [Candidatus Eremiobacteraceae bacterium]|nr:glycosyltransferase 87 family protein [Candidatus Eremiobacteraceae bacterium]